MVPSLMNHPSPSIPPLSAPTRADASICGSFHSKKPHFPLFCAKPVPVSPLFAILTDPPLTPSKYVTLSLLLATLMRHSPASPLLATPTKNAGCLSLPLPQSLYILLGWTP